MPSGSGLGNPLTTTGKLSLPANTVLVIWCFYCPRAICDAKIALGARWRRRGVLPKDLVYNVSIRPTVTLAMQIIAVIA